jgi:diacylglycerol kinase
MQFTESRSPEAVMSASNPQPSEATVPPRRRRPWRDKFRAAFRGLKLGIRGHSSFFVHFFFAALVIAVGIPLKLPLVEWCLILGCIGLVLTAELFNSAVETLFRGLDEAAKARSWPALDIAAGAVLLASLFAVVIGCLVFIPRLYLLGVELFSS